MRLAMPRVLQWMDSAAARGLLCDMDIVFILSAYTAARVSLEAGPLLPGHIPAEV